LWLHSLKVAQLLRSAACLHTNQSRSYLNHLVLSVGNTVNANTVTSLLTDCAVVLLQNVRNFITTYLKQKNTFN